MKGWLILAVMVTCCAVSTDADAHWWRTRYRTYYGVPAYATYYSAPVYVPGPVYVPAPVYVAPQPVVVSYAPVIVRPAPVFVSYRPVAYTTYYAAPPVYAWGW